MLQFYYGTYHHEVGEVDVSRRREVLRSTATGNAIGLRHQWTLTGMLLGDGVTSIDLAVKNLIIAYNTTVQYCGMYDTVLHAPVASFWQKSINTLTGIRVLNGPSFPTGDGTQHVTQYNYTIELEWTVPFVDDAYKEFQETLTFSGGGPSYLHLEPLYGNPVKVLAKQNTVFHVQQSGFATGWRSRPAPPAPLWPGALMRAPTFRKMSPRSEGGTQIDFRTEWDYSFESGFALNGEPNYVS